MLFFPNATVYISDLKTIKNAEGTKIKTYDFGKNAYYYCGFYFSFYFYNIWL